MPSSVWPTRSSASPSVWSAPWPCWSCWSRLSTGPRHPGTECDVDQLALTPSIRTERECRMPTEQPFEGVIGRTLETSTPWWPPLAQAPDGAPNVVVVLLDDVGYAQFGCYGSDIATPTFDRLAANGLRYSNFHTTALCSPTRAALLTGRNHHTNGMGRVVEIATGFPGYDATVPKDSGFLSEILLGHGYATFAVGKWHL